MNWELTLNILLLAICSSFGLQSINLNGVWTVSNANRSIRIAGQVPGSMYTALMNNKIIGDPYFRKNDELYKWIAEDDWQYSRSFDVTSQLLQSQAVVLICEGLDTVSTVVVNNVTVGKSDNMFVRYVFDIKSALLVGTNSISINFKSATAYVRQQAQTSSYPILPECVPPEYHGECGANLIRKMQCSFSWDWGPSFPTQGIWKDIYIQWYASAAIRDITTETARNNNGTWQLKVTVFAEVRPGLIANGQLEVTLVNTSIARQMNVSLTSINNKATFDINIPQTAQIKAWWPNGYGNQTLYDLLVVLSDAYGDMDTQKVRIGFRTVELVQDYVSANKSLGRTFYFRINGQPIFLKGSNWIPADSFLERITRDLIYNYLKSAADVHMNALRVWGGGIYEFDEFYEMADELGIMIWQDFMFACSMYPTNVQFLESVKLEVTHQMRRLKHHPSIVIYSGNNENEKALVQDWYGTDVNYTLYKNDYLKLYKDTIYSIVLQEDTSRPFVSSSPSNGVETEQEGWIAKEPWSTLYGDIHEYKYLVPFYDPNQFRIPRMCSEFGLQSYPSMESLEPVYNVSDMSYWSDLNDYRNHHPFGNIEMMAEAIQFLNIPNSPDIKQRFKDIIYITQIDHAVGMKTMTEHYRRWQNRLDNQGQGNTMGALYWMLADIWEAPTWASLEFGGKWKMLHYFAQHFFAPTLLSPYLDGDDIDVYIILDELNVTVTRQAPNYTIQFRPKNNPRPFGVFDLSTWETDGIESVKPNKANDDFSGNLYMEMYTWSSMVPLKAWKVPFQVNSTSQSVYRHNLDDLVSTSGCIRSLRCFLYFHLGDQVNGPTNWYPLSTFNSEQGIQHANITITEVRETSNVGEFIVSLTSDAIAPFVWLEAYRVKGRFSDNGFLMINNNKSLTFYAWESVDVLKLRSSLTVKSLMDVYY